MNNWIPNNEDLLKDLDSYINNMTENERKWFEYFCDKFGWDNPYKSDSNA